MKKTTTLTIALYRYSAQRSTVEIIGCAGWEVLS